MHWGLARNDPSRKRKLSLPHNATGSCQLDPLKLQLSPARCREQLQMRPMSTPRRLRQLRRYDPNIQQPLEVPCALFCPTSPGHGHVSPFHLVSGAESSKDRAWWDDILGCRLTLI